MGPTEGRNVLRWSVEETEKLAIIKAELKEDLAGQAPYPEVVGDRKLVRMIRAYPGEDHPESAIDAMRRFLKWRKKFNVDRIRNHIAMGQACDPEYFPHGSVVNHHAPAIICDPNVRDANDFPIGLETYQFKAKDVFQAITIDQYCMYLVYNCEYKALVLEQVSEEAERAYLAECGVAGPSPSAKGYGKIYKMCFFRDLRGIGMGHLWGQGRQMVQRSLKIAQDFYPETLSKSYMINCSWAFTAVWALLKGFLHPRTVAKISILGNSDDIVEELAREVPMASLPAHVGGPYEAFNPPLAFQTQVGGALHCTAAVAPTPAEVEFHRNEALSFETINTDDTESGSRSTASASPLPVGLTQQGQVASGRQVEAASEVQLAERLCATSPNADQGRLVQTAGSEAGKGNARPEAPSSASSGTAAGAGSTTSSSSSSNSSNNSNSNSTGKAAAVSAERARVFSRFAKQLEPGSPGSELDSGIGAGTGTAVDVRPGAAAAPQRAVGLLEPWAVIVAVLLATLSMGLLWQYNLTGVAVLPALVLLIQTLF